MTYTIYSYTYLSDGQGPWWGIKCPQNFYEQTVREMHETTRCFVYLTNSKGDTLAIAIEGPHNEGDSNIFVPDWVLTRLGISDSDTVTMDAILEPLPKGDTVKIRPLTGSTVEGPMFLEGLTEALNQLGIVQEGLLSAIVDPSMPEIHEFMIEDLSPSRVCLADGELRVELERALDRPPTPVQEMKEDLIEEKEDEDFDSVIPVTTVKKGFVAFGGTGHTLGGCYR